jgi:hypothetical protein
MEIDEEKLEKLLQSYRDKNPARFRKIEEARPPHRSSHEGSLSGRRERRSEYRRRYIAMATWR